MSGLANKSLFREVSHPDIDNLSVSVKALHPKTLQTLSTFERESGNFSIQDKWRDCQLTTPITRLFPMRPRTRMMAKEMGTKNKVSLLMSFSLSTSWLISEELVSLCSRSSNSSSASIFVSETRKMFLMFDSAYSLKVLYGIS